MLSNTARVLLISKASAVQSAEIAESILPSQARF
jgi:hypothetical protein